MTTTAAQALTEMLLPHLRRVAGTTGSPESDLFAAVCLTQQEDREATERRMRHLDEIVGALAGTYDEFRSEAAA